METINVGKKEESMEKNKKNEVGKESEQTKLDIRVPIFRKMELTIKSLSEGEFMVKKDKNTWNVCFKRVIVVGGLFDESLANNFAEKYNKITKEIKEAIQLSMEEAEKQVQDMYENICNNVNCLVVPGKVVGGSTHGSMNNLQKYDAELQKKVKCPELSHFKQQNLDFGKINSVVMDLDVPPCITPKEASVLSSGPPPKPEILTPGICKYTECNEHNNNNKVSGCNMWNDITMCTGVVKKKPEVKQCQYPGCPKYSLISVSKCGEFGDISKCTSDIKKNLIMEETNSLPVHLSACEKKECSDYNELIECRCNTFEDISCCSKYGGDDLPF